ncbi:bifunctional DNA primase/polymerase [Nocardia cyriacigeorgica]|uniref:bifunctional DNA primase/polymerase n=1 Tax=Nocardia cyriacigeorgica TaxID=135487 RepID=UPI001893F74D|nr:bifunctional DNA primase/polymerase [Nocardia cyriacigeorgica]MBF6162169.1 hypothetical protein [Nocardia cyriacigeorgica]MBF6200769.1 hypothetical protein [Nocardia cyriacigeorgica]
MDDHAEFWGKLTVLDVPLFVATPRAVDHERGPWARPPGWPELTGDSNAEQLARWRPGYAVCVLGCDAVAVLDCDPRRNPDIVAKVRAALAAQDIRVYAEVVTPGGGRHFYVAGHPALRSRTFGDSSEWAGLEVKSHGLNVFTVGTSRHDGGYGGRGYAVESENLDALADGGDSDSAEALVEWLECIDPTDDGDHAPDSDPYDGHELTSGERRYLEVTVAGECAAVNGAAEGGRNERLNIAAFKLGRRVSGAGLDEATAFTALLDAALASGLPRSEAQATIRSGLRAGKKHPRAIGSAYALTAEEEAEFWESRPVLAHIRRFARARRVGPWSTLAVVLARTVTMVEPDHVLPPLVGGAASLNLFLALVGAPGQGKGGSSRAAADAVRFYRAGFAPPCDDSVTTAQLGSGEGITRQYRRHVPATKTDPAHDVWVTRAVLFEAAEVDTVAALKTRSGATLQSELCKAWSGEALGFAYAAADKRVTLPVGSYRLCLVVGVQPLRSNAIFEAADSGLPQRFGWFPVIDPAAPDVAPDEPEPWQWPGLGEVPGDGPVTLAVPDEIRRTVDIERLAQVRGEAAGLDGHATLLRIKFAAALALLEGRTDITGEDWELSGLMLRKSDATRDAIAEAVRAEQQRKLTALAHGRAELEATVETSKADRAVERVAGLIRRKLPPAEWVTRKTVRKWIASRDREHMDAALERLVNSGHVVTQTAARGDASHSVYRLRE